MNISLERAGLNRFSDREDKGRAKGDGGEGRRGEVAGRRMQTGGEVVED